MNLYKKIDNNLSKFTTNEFMYIKLVYLFISLLIVSLYQKLTTISFLFYLIMLCIFLFPLVLEGLSYKGDREEKLEQYLIHNTVSKQVLVFSSCFFVGIILSQLFPFLLNIKSYVYLFLIILFAVKPMKKSLYW